MKVLDFFKNNPNLEKKEFSKGQIIFRLNQSCNNVSLVLKGTVKIVNYSLDGQEEVLSLINENSLFANALIFAEDNRYLGDVIAMENSTLIMIEKDILILQLQNDSEFLQDYIKLISQKTIELNQKNKLLLHKNIAKRVLYYLEMHDGKCDRTVSSLAIELGIIRPCLSRVVNSLIKEGIIAKNKNNRIYLIRK